MFGGTGGGALLKIFDLPSGAKTHMGPSSSFTISKKKPNEMQIFHFQIDERDCKGQVFDSAVYGFMVSMGLMFSRTNPPQLHKLNTRTWRLPDDLHSETTSRDGIVPQVAAFYTSKGWIVET